MLSGKEYLQQIQKEELNYVMVCKMRVVTMETNVTDLPEEIQEMLSKFSGIVVDDIPNELPLRRDISHQIDFIPGANLPNKVAYRLTPQENEEVRRQVQGLLDKGLVQKSQSPCAVLAVLTPKKDGEWRMCTESRAINNITIIYRFPLPRMDDMMDFLSGEMCFSKTGFEDWISSYHNHGRR